MTRNKAYHSETSPVIPMTASQSQLFEKLECPKISLEEARKICKEFGTDDESKKYIEGIFADGLKKASLKENSPSCLKKLYDAVPEYLTDHKQVIAKKISKTVSQSYKKTEAPLALKQLYTLCPKDECFEIRQIIIEKWDQLFLEKVQGGLSIQAICKTPELVTIVLFSPVGSKCFDQIKKYFEIVFEKVKKHHPDYFSDHEKYICPEAFKILTTS